MPCLRSNNNVVASIPGQSSLEKPLDPRLAEYSVTGLTRHETCGSTRKALFENIMVNTGRVGQEQTGMA